ncbi:MAG: response regulator [Ardenticatenaceae bacterium]
MEMTLKRILVVDNDPDVLDSVRYNLRSAGYEVVTANCPDEARQQLACEIVHLAVIDIRLEDERRREDHSGFDVAQKVPDYIPCVIFTAYENTDNLRKALGEVGAKASLDKKDPLAASKLVDIVDECFASVVKVNFALKIEGTLDLNRVASQIEVPRSDENLRPSALDVRQILQTLFHDAQAVYATLLLSAQQAPTFTQAGSLLIRARARYEHAWGAPVVVKFSAREEIESEAKNYHYIKRYLGGQRLPVLREENGVAYSRQLGGLVYTLIGAQNWESICEFGQIYREHETERVIDLLKRFFRQTFGALFEDATRQPLNLTTSYTDALRLTPEKLRRAVQEVHPDGLREPTLRFNGLSAIANSAIANSAIANSAIANSAIANSAIANSAIANKDVPNPIMWALPDNKFRTFNTFSRQCLCHGDLHNKNMLVDGEGHFWLIDFARVAESHALRDFAELESDIKFNLLSVVDLKDLFVFEQALLTPTHSQDAYPNISFGNPHLDHAYRVVAALRRIAYDLIRLDGDMREYYQALFWHTLNIIRLRHITPQKKEHALLSAALICQRLEEWPKWHLPANGLG